MANNNSNSNSNVAGPPAPYTKLNQNNNANTGTNNTANSTSGNNSSSNTSNTNSNTTNNAANNTKKSNKTLESKMVNEGMQNFKDMLDLLDDKFCKGRPIYTMYFKMTLNNNNQVLVDTTSQDWDENCLVSFKNELNGSGEANQFTLGLLFKPNDRNIKSIRTLEAKLLSNVTIYKDNDNGELKDLDALYSACSFQYGYGDDEKMRSPMYSGMILDYDCSLENGNLKYIITGVAGLSPMSESRLSPKDEYLKDENGNEIDEPLRFIENIVRIELKEKGLYTFKLLDDIKSEEVVTAGEDYKTFNQKNIFEIISDILSGCMTKEQYDAMSGAPSSSTPGPNQQKRILPSQKQMFNFYVSNVPVEEDGKKYQGTIYIYKMPSANGEENKDSAESVSADLGITFNWFGPGSEGYNGIVKSWNPKYDGSLLLGLAVNLLTHDNSTTYYSMNADGDVIKVQGLGAAREGTLTNDTNDKILSTIQEYSNWSFVTQYPYQATMTTIGCPCEVPMTGKIKINALMGEELHHSSGIYMVLKKTDTINNSGFWSDFELFKIQRGYDPEYAVIDGNNNSSNSAISGNNGSKQTTSTPTVGPNYSNIISQGNGPVNPYASTTFPWMLNGSNNNTINSGNTDPNFVGPPAPNSN